MVISNSARFWLYLIPVIPSIICAMLRLYRLRISRTFGTTLRNHDKFLLLSCVLIGELFDVTWHIHYYHTGTVLSSTPSFCIVWAFIGSATSVSSSFLIAWTSIERHIVTFYPEWLLTRTKRFFFHYIPLSACILYPTVFYFVIFCTISCDVPFDYNSRLCNRSECIFRSHSIALWDSFIHYVMPVCATVIFTVALLARVVYYRHRIYERVEWDKYKRIAIKMLPTFVFYILLQFPPMVLYAAYSTGLSRSVAADYYNDCTYFRYWIILFIPFVYSTPSSERQRKHRTIFVFWKKRRAVVQPVIIDITPQVISDSDAVASIGS